MHPIAINTPEFLKVQLETYAGLSECCRFVSDAFCETYTAASTREQINDRTWLHRSLLIFFHDLHTGKPIHETSTISDYFMDLLTCYDDGLLRWTKVILAVFDSYILIGNIEVQKEKEFKYCQDLRNAIIEVLINHYDSISKIR